MPPRRKRQTTENSNHSHESKEFSDARNAVLLVNPENLPLIPNKPNEISEQLEDDQLSTDILRLLNIANFLEEVSVLISSCPFHIPEENKLFVIGIKELANLKALLQDGGNATDYLNEYKASWDKIRHIAVHVDINMFHEMFSGSRSSISSVLRHVMQLANDDPNSNPEFFESFNTVSATWKRLATRLSVLMHSRKIRTVITLWDKLVETQNEVLQFFKSTGLMTPDMMATANNCFRSMFDAVLYLKLLVIIQQFVPIVDRCLSHQLKCPVPPIPESEDEGLCNDDEEISEKQIGRIITDELILSVHETTGFLKSYKIFLEKIKPTMEKGEFLKIFQSFLKEAQKFDRCDLPPTLFNLFYKFRKLQMQTMSTMLLAETNNSSSPIIKIQSCLQILFNTFKSLVGKEIDTDAVRELLYPAIENVKQTYKSDQIKPNDFESMQVHDVLACLENIYEELQIIDDTLCATFQVDQCITKLKENDLPMFNFNCMFYEPPTLSSSNESKIEENKFDDPKSNDQKIIERKSIKKSQASFLSIYYKFIQIFESNQIVNGLKSSNLSKICAFDISSIISVFLENLKYHSIQTILKSPPSENDFFSCLYETHKMLMLEDDYDESLDKSLTLFSHVYYFLLSLDASGIADFSNSIHLIYLRSFASLKFKEDLIGNISLVEPFSVNSLSSYKEIIDKLKENPEISMINSKLSSTKLLFFQFMETIIQLPTEIIDAHYESLSKILGWFLYTDTLSMNSMTSHEFLDILNTMKNANISQLDDTIDVLLDLQNTLMSYHQIIPIHGYLCSFFNIELPESSFWQPILPIWLDSVHRCIENGTVSCNKDALIALETAMPTNINELCHNFQQGMTITYEFLFHQISSVASSLNDLDMKKVVDLIIRGGFSPETVQDLFKFILKIHSTTSNDKILPVWESAKQLCSFLIFVELHDELFKSIDTSILSQINLREFLIFYCNSILFLITSLNVKPELACLIKEKSTDLKRLARRINISKKIDKNTYKELIALYSEVRLRFASISPSKITNNLRELVEQLEDDSVESLKEILDETIDSIDSSPNIEISQQLFTKLIEEIHSTRLNEETMAEITNILNTMNTLILYSSRIRDSDAFFDFLTSNKTSIDMLPPPVIPPLEEDVQYLDKPPLISNQYLFNDKDPNFLSFCENMLDNISKKAVNNDITQNGEIFSPPTYVLPLESQQLIINMLYEEESKLTSLDVKPKPHVINPEIEILECELRQLENEARMYNKNIELLNQSTKDLYDEIMMSQSPEHNKLYELNNKVLEELNQLSLHERDLRNQMKAAQYTYERKTAYMDKLNAQNVTLLQANKMISSELENLRKIKNDNASKALGNSDDENQKFIKRQAVLDKLNIIKPEQIIIPDEAAPPPDEQHYVPEVIQDLMDPKFLVMTPEDNEMISRTVAQWERIHENCDERKSVEVENTENETSESGNSSSTSLVSSYAYESLREKHDDCKRRTKNAIELAHDLLKKVSLLNDF